VLGASLEIGDRKFSIADVQDLASRGENLLLQHGGRMQAAMALLLVAAEQRLGGREGYALLEQRIAAYEARQGES
jgi:hypothetical protein